MALTIAEEQRDGVTVLKLTGRLVLGEESNELRTTIKRLLDAGDNKILVDLNGVSYIDSAGLGTLVAGFTSSRNAGGTMKLANLTKKVNEQLNITKLVTVFDVFDNVAAGLKSFS
ncbi:MAG TPA: STAS domain-containing protein [Terriglobia bacterium]|jgi:anti-sigma B factor antagonist|nr:STAS domain-containing protein [Terriglobia bacterium]